MTTDNKTNEDLLKVRNRIDAIDDQFLLLLKERLCCAKEIGRLKNKENRAKWDPLRERQIFERLKALNNGEFPEQPMISIFREIITTCRLSQKAVEVGDGVRNAVTVGSKVHDEIIKSSNIFTRKTN